MTTSGFYPPKARIDIGLKFPICFFLFTLPLPASGQNPAAKRFVLHFVELVKQSF